MGFCLYLAHSSKQAVTTGGDDADDDESRVRLLPLLTYSLTPGSRFPCFITIIIMRFLFLVQTPTQADLI